MAALTHLLRLILILWSLSFTQIGGSAVNGEYAVHPGPAVSPSRRFLAGVLKLTVLAVG